jgi:hypothetical protein
MTLSTTSTIALFDTNKEQRKQFSQLLINEVLDGKASALDIHYKLKCMIEIAEATIDDSLFKTAILDEASKYPKKFIFKESEMQIAEVGVKYDYSQCNDDELNELLAQKTSLETAIKNRQTFLKTIPATGLELRKNDELVTLFPPTKTSTTTLKTTLK